MLKRLIVLLTRTVAGVLAATAILQASGIQLTIADTTGKSGDTLLVAVRVSTIALSDSVYSGQLTVSYNSSVIRVFDVDTSGTLLGGFGSVLFNPTTGVLVFAGTSRLAGSGVLLNLKTAVVGSPGIQTTITGTGLLNEGRPTLTITNGRVRILAIVISPKNPSTPVVGDSVQFTVTGDQKLPLTWSVSNSSVGTIDTTGKFKAIAPGQVRVYVKDAQNLQDSTSLFPVYPSQAKSLTVSVHDTSCTQTLFFNMPVYITNVTGLGIVSAQFALTYSSSILQAVDVIRAGSKTSTWSAPSFNVTSGRVDVGLAGTDTLAGAGILVYVRFRVLPSASGSTTVSLASVLFNENLNAATVSGQFTALAAPTVVVAPNTAILTVGDTLRFSVTSGGRSPYVWSSTNPSVASVNGSGLLTALSRGTTTVSVTDSFGFVGTSGLITVNDFRISMPDTAMGLNDSIAVPILAGDLTGLGVLSFETRIVYDSTVVRIGSIITSGTLSNGFTVVAKDTLDTLRIAAAGSLPMAGSGSLIKIRLKTQTSSTGVSSQLRFAFFKFNEGVPTATTKNGSIAIVAVPTVPTLNSPADSASGISLNPTLIWNSSAGASSFRLQVSTSSVFSTTFLDSSGLLSTSFSINGLTTSTIYFWRVSAKNAAGSSAYSSARRFTTAGSIPGVPVLVSPADNAANTSRSLRFVWMRPQGASTYRVQISTNSLFSTTFVDSSGIVDSSAVFTGLASSTLYYWRVSAANGLGSSAFSASRSFTTGTLILGLESVKGDLPLEFRLEQNFPNPFNPTTSIRFSLPERSFVRLRVFAVSGVEVASLVSREMNAGTYQVSFDAASLSSGAYFYSIQTQPSAGSNAQPASRVLKMLLIK